MNFAFSSHRVTVTPEPVSKPGAQTRSYLKRWSPGKSNCQQTWPVAAGLLWCLLLVAPSVNAQSITLDYFPEKGHSVTSEEYRKGKYILENTYQAIKDSDGKIVYADLWNVGIAYANMGVDHETTLRMFQESKLMDAASFGEVVGHMLNGKDLNETRLFKLLGQPFKELVRDCDVDLKPTTLDQLMAEKREIDLSDLNEGLIDQLLVLLEKDQRYRYSSVIYRENRDAQNELDQEVQLAIAKLFDKYGYPGRSLVGERFAGHACLLLEHGGELAHQEKYFPLVAEAFKQGEVPRSVVLMLVDRLHWKKTKKQIFGSHIGIPFDSDEVIQKVKGELGW